MGVTRVVFAGASGNVGRALAPLLEASPEVEYAGAVARTEDMASRLRELGAEVLVDFTRPEVGLENALAAVSAGVAPVVGTSGIPADGVDRLEAACRAAGLGGMVAPNFAIGGVVMMWLAEKAAPYFDAVEIVEGHGAAKADSPSGTAVSTARRLNAARAGGHPFDRRPPQKQVLEGARGASEGGVAVHSIRLPGLLAEQQVIYGLPGQTLTIEHRTTSREAYGPGVLMAIRAVVETRRFYRGLDELLGLGQARGWGGETMPR